MLKLVPKLKTNRSLKLLLVDMKANSSILIRFMVRMAQNKQQCLIFIVVPRVKVVNNLNSPSSELNYQDIAFSGYA